MPTIRTASIAAGVSALIVAQVILPATLDLMASLAIAGGAGFAGFKLGRR